MCGYLTLHVVEVVGATSDVLEEWGIRSKITIQQAVKNLTERWDVFRTDVIKKPQCLSWLNTHLKGLDPSLLLDEFDYCIRLHLHMLPLQFIHETRLIKEICITSQHLRRKGIKEIQIWTKVKSNLCASHNTFFKEALQNVIRSCL